MLLDYLPWLIAMLVLVFCSAFFSASEAALFYLRRRTRRRMAGGNRAQQVAARLLADPDRLLTAVLFWNLVVNLAYFAIAASTSIRLEHAGHAAVAGIFGIGSLLVIIVFSEMLPKSLAVMFPRGLATLVSIPLATLVRVIDPLLPALRLVDLLSRRLLWPRFTPEPYLRIGDLERAVQLSTSDTAILEQEQAVLQNIVLLAEIRADELMRPRVQFRTFSPPVSLADLEGKLPPSGYLLTTEPDSDEVAGAIALRALSSIPTEHLEYHAETVVYVPWSTSVAEVLEVMRRHDRQVAAVVNEFGETIGILTFDDILDTIFTAAASRSERLLQQPSIRRVSAGRWQVTGMTSLRRLVRHFQVERPPSKSVTVAGVIQETLERLPEPGDKCCWGPFEFHVLDVRQRGQLLVELTTDADVRKGTP